MSVLRVLETRYQKEIKYEVINLRDAIEIEATGPEDLVPHGNAMITMLRCLNRYLQNTIRSRSN
jgi:hypothetical protein